MERNYWIHRISHFAEIFRAPLEEIAIYERTDNSAVLQQYAGKTVNVKYDRVLTAVMDSNGKPMSTAYTICLPYDFDVSQYCKDGQVQLYRLALVDDHYKEFVFTNDFPFASAGLGYLVVVNNGSVSLNASGVKITAKPMHEEWADQTVVYSYADYKKFTAEEITSFDPIGTWRGTFKAIENDEAAAMAAYGSFAGGYLRIISNDTEEHRKGRIGTFRAFYEPKNHKSFGATNGVIRYYAQLLAGSNTGGSGDTTSNARRFGSPWDDEE